MKRCLFALLLATLFLSGCSAPETKHALVFGINQAPTSLDPAAANDVIYYQIAFNLFETLIAVDWESRQFVPGLATSWQSDSAGLRWTFKLRPRVVFHDGSPLNAEAVKISFTRQFDPRSPYFQANRTTTYGHFAFSMIEEIRAVNDSTVQFILKYPYSAFLDNLATPNFATIVSPRALREAGENFGQQPVGTGPFHFARWEPQRRIVIKKFLPYWGTPAPFDSVIYEIVPGLETKLQMLKKGELDIISGLSAASVNPLYREPNVNVVTKPLIATVFLGFNCATYPFNNVSMRRAVAHALDNAAIVAGVSRDFAAVARGPLPPMTLGYDSALAFPSYDPELAKALLKNSGYQKAPMIKFYHFIQTDTMRADPFAQAIKSYLEKIGIQAELVPFSDWKNYQDSAFVGGKSQLFLDGWIGYTHHPDNFLFPLFHSQSAHNFFKYKSPQVDSLLELARRAPDEQTQRVIYRNVQEILLQDVPAVFMSHPKAVYAIRDRVKNFKVDPLAIPWLNAVKLE